MTNPLTHAAQILIVEDDLDTRDVMREVLTDEGYEVRCASDGAEAMRMADDLPWALVLLDLMMPRMDGWDFLDGLRRHPRLHDVPVVVLSAARGRDQERISGVQARLQKPIPLQDLVGIVRKVLTRPEEVPGGGLAPRLAESKGS